MSRYSQSEISHDSLADNATDGESLSGSFLGIDDNFASPLFQRNQVRNSEVPWSDWNPTSNGGLGIFGVGYQGFQNNLI